jgi:hypothetical protein
VHHHTPFARRQSELDHFQLVLSNERAKTGSEGAWSVDCEGAGVLNGLSGLEPERKQRKGGASDRMSTLCLADWPRFRFSPFSHVTAAFIVSWPKGVSPSEANLLLSTLTTESK